MALVWGRRPVELCSIREDFSEGVISAEPEG